MMLLLEFIQSLLQAISFWGGESCADQGAICYSSALNSITAAYQTMGLWAAADLVHQVLYTQLGASAQLIYVISAIGGLISLALGAPPKLYLWFFMGPTIYWWLLGNRVMVHGVEWCVAKEAVDQREVWKLAEVGLANSGAVFRGGYERDPLDTGAVPSVNVSRSSPPSQPVPVPYFMMVWDEIVSSVTQELIVISGMYTKRGSLAPGGLLADSNLPVFAATTTIEPNDKWFLLTNTKWELIDSIASAKVSDPNLRQALNMFLGGPCGDAFSKVLDPSAFANAMYGKGKTAPVTIFRRPPGRFDNILNLSVGSSIGDVFNEPLLTEQYTGVIQRLTNEYVRVPDPVRKMLTDNTVGSFRNSVNWGTQSWFSGGTDGEIQNIVATPSMQCIDFLNIIIAGFRWQSGQIYYQLVNSIPGNLSELSIVYNLLYGWNVQRFYGIGPFGVGVQLLPGRQQQNFIKDLILVHLLRNEFRLSKPLVANPQTSSQTAREGGDMHLGQIATKNKFIEIYHWAMLLPHMQGVMLYYLAIAYPIACLLMIMPGQHKAIFTWMSFWAWVKLWDVGFALVMSLERSVWAMLGSGSNIQRVFWRIASMQSWGSVGVDSCVDKAACPISPVIVCSSTDIMCSSPLTSIIGGWASFLGGGLATGSGAITMVRDSTGFGGAIDTDLADQLRIFDRGLTMAANLDLDVTNSYYLYIMAGLYFAVPAVIGQMVLGARAGAASFVNNVIGGVGQEGGRMAAATAQGDWQTRIGTNQQQQRVAAMAKGTGLVSQALGAQNEAFTGDSGAAYLQTASGLNDARAGVTDANAKEFGLQNGAAQGVYGGAGAIKNGLPQSATGQAANGGAGGSGGANSGRRWGWGTAQADSLLRGVGGTASQLGQFHLSYDSNRVEVGRGIQNARNTAGAFELGQNARAASLAADRTMQQAAYEAELAGYDAANEFAAANGALGAALGGTAGSMVQSVPFNMVGMARRGDLDSGGGTIRGASPFWTSFSPPRGPGQAATFTDRGQPGWAAVQRASQAAARRAEDINSFNNNRSSWSDNMTGGALRGARTLANPMLGDDNPNFSEGIWANRIADETAETIRQIEQGPPKSE